MSISFVYLYLLLFVHFVRSVLPFGLHCTLLCLVGSLFGYIVPMMAGWYGTDATSGVDWEKLGLMVLAGICFLAFLFVLRKYLAILRTTHHSKLSQGSPEAEMPEPEPVAAPSVPDGRPMQERQFLAEVTTCVYEAIRTNKLSIEQIASDMNMSRSSFSRRILSLTGTTPNAYILRIRMEKARRLLRTTEKAVYEVAIECGFEESSYFIRCFKQTQGVTPLQYRNTPE